MIALTAAAVTGAGVTAAALLLTSGDAPGVVTVQERVSTESVALTSVTDSAIGEVYARSASGVVEITAAGTSDAGPFGDQRTQAEGSGFVLDEDGNIVTNAHVVTGAEAITVTFSSGTQVAATLVGEDASSDLAVVKVDVPAGELTPLPLGESGDVQVGDSVVAIGSPFGYEGTLTLGIVSALGRSVDAPNGYPITGAIQTDAALNPGNSGGPLLDMTGNVIGVNAQIASRSGGSEGVGFAIPVDTVRQVAAQLAAGETVEHAYLGVSLITVDETAAATLGVPRGVQIASVRGGSPAAAAGLRAGTDVRAVSSQDYTTDGDVVIAIGGVPVASADELVAAIGARSPGDRVVLSVSRDGTELDIEVTLGTRPA